MNARGSSAVADTAASVTAAKLEALEAIPEPCGNVFAVLSSIPVSGEGARAAIPWRARISGPSLKQFARCASARARASGPSDGTTARFSSCGTSEGSSETHCAGPGWGLRKTSA